MYSISKKIGIETKCGGEIREGGVQVDGNKTNSKG
jgi:hypothetical protein